MEKMMKTICVVLSERINTDLVEEIIAYFIILQHNSLFLQVVIDFML